MTIKNNEEAIDKLRASLSRLKDDMAMVQNELNMFKKAVAKYISTLLDTSHKMQNDPKLRQ